MPDLLSIGGTTAGPALCCFRLVLGAALLWKIIADHVFGMARFFDLEPKSLLRWRYERDEMAVKVLLSPSAFRVCYVARAVAVVCLLTGILIPMAAGVVAVWCMFEFTFDRKFNTLFLGLMCVPFVFAAQSDAYLSLQSLLDAPSVAAFLRPPAAVGGEPVSWPQVAAVVLMFQVYWSSAWHKAASRQFTSGDVLQKTFEQLASVRADLPPGRREYYFPDWFTRRFAVAEVAAARRWRLPSLATIAVEAALPLLLIFPLTWPVGALLGISMHAAFTSILPKRLAPFGLASAGTYLLFLPQHTFASLVGGLT